MRYLMLLLALSGCGTGMTWSGMGPPPILPRPGVGLPLIGQPGQRERSLPPSPNKRILPATKEPGIWAADEIRAGKEPEYVILDGVGLPFPPDATSGAQRKPAYDCKRSLHKAFRQLYSPERWRIFGEVDKAHTCFVAQLFSHCAVANFLDLKDRLHASSDSATPDLANSHRVMQTAVQYAERVCAGLPRRDDVGRLYVEVITAWEQLR